MLNIRRLSSVAFLVIILAVILYPSFTTGIITIRVTDSGEKSGEAMILRCKDLALHRAGESDTIGWITMINQTSSFNLIQPGNLSETLVRSRVPAGRYDKIRFTVSEATMTFNGSETRLGLVTGEVTTPLDFVISSGGTVVVIDFRTEFKQAVSQKTYRSSPVAYIA
jgi:hypothetical protein